MTETKASRRKMILRLLSTESEWNPKVALVRVITAALPDKWLFSLKKAYYPLLLRYWGDQLLENGERDAIVVKHLVSPGDQVLDIGASVGLYTKYLSDLVGPAGLVYSFEPLPPTFEILTNCVRRLGLNNVQLFNGAVSDDEGFSEMVVPLYRWGAECYYDARIRRGSEGGPLRRFRVATKTIDSVFGPGSSKLSFIKCDVNYHELHFIKGALRTIRGFHPSLLIEVGTNPDESEVGQVFAILASEGYGAYYFDGTSLRTVSKGQRSQNCFFLCDTHLALLQARCPDRLAVERE
jgi:FkbM family methyltransferase